MVLIENQHSPKMHQSHNVSAIVTRVPGLEPL